MIKRTLTIKVQGNRCVCDAPLYLHTQDKNIHVVINVTNTKFEIKDDMLLSFTLIKPNGDEVNKSDCYIDKGQCHLLFNGEDFNEETEVGTHLVQLKLYDKDRQARLSLPPFAMHILKSSGEFYADEEMEGLLAEQNAYKLMTENKLALEMSQSILISDLPTTTKVEGYAPVTFGNTTYKLDMSQVATKDELEHNHDTVYAPKSHTHSQYITEHQDISHLATKDELYHNHDKQYAPINHEHPQYLTEHQDISHLASKAYVANAIADAQLSGEGEEIDLSGYATKDDLLTKADKQHTHSQYLTQHQDISHLATKEELVHNHDNQYAPKTHSHEEYALAEHTHEQYLTEHQDLSDYALKTELPTVPTKVSELTNDSGFITIIPSEYVTDEELNAKGYLTEHQDVSGLATRQELTDGLATKSDTSHTHTGMLTSTTITRIELVDTLPEQQEENVLYIVRGE